MRVFQSSAIFGLSIALSGCADNLSNLVRVARLPRPAAEVTTPFEGQSQVKLSPGHQISVASDNSISMHANITTTDRELRDLGPGGTISARVTLGRVRSSDNSSSSLSIRAPSSKPTQTE